MQNSEGWTGDFVMNPMGLCGKAHLSLGHRMERERDRSGRRGSSTPTILGGIVAWASELYRINGDRTGESNNVPEIRW